MLACSPAALAAGYTEAGDAGQTRATAQDTSPVSPLTYISGHVQRQDADIYRLTLPAGTTSFCPAAYDIQFNESNNLMIFLWDEAGRPREFNDNFGPWSLDAGIPHTTRPIAPGTYYVGVSQYRYGYGLHNSDAWPSDGSTLTGKTVPYLLELNRNGQCDDDEDETPNANDNCPFASNYSQDDDDGNGVGDVCEGDIDNDGVEDEARPTR